MGFEYSPLYTSRLEDLSVSVTRKGSQAFIDSADYTLQFMGELPASAGDKPYVEISVDDPAGCAGGFRQSYSEYWRTINYK
ncbi:MAG: hypothetical protein PQJ58_15540 [Spirochaetales bacterium]|nr:hypothetical protein [Spirochaetales bacterium]